SFSFFNGLQQAFPVQSGATASVDVDVLSGVVLLALFANNGGTFIGGTTSTQTNQWETLSFTAPAGNKPNLIVLYTDKPIANLGGEFYADNASVPPLAAGPEPSSALAVATATLAGLGVWARRRWAARLPSTGQ